ncbi:MAG: T9SS type B sorting domain-containing protein, partial [Bacteroidales bacterium]|nr:T9SS type B sorting domain-containing protein [Bacteroidales bacterium]
LTANGNNGTVSQGTYNPTSGLWTIGTIDNGDIATLSLEGTVDTGQGGNTITNITTTATGDQDDPTDVGDDLSESVVVNNDADIVITKIVDDINPDENGIIVYTIEISNNGPAQVTNLVVTDNMPAGVTYISGTTTTGSWTSPIWTVGTVNSGTTVSLEITASVDPDTGGTTITNIASHTQDQNDTNLTTDDPTEDIMVDRDSPLIISGNGINMINDTIVGISSCENIDFDICLIAENADGLIISEINVLTGNGSQVIDPVADDLCFEFLPATNFSGIDVLEIIVCNDNPIPLCVTVYLVIEVIPQVEAYAGMDAEICETTTSFTLSSATATDFDNILWTTDGSGTFDDPTAIHPIYTPSSLDIDDGQVILGLLAEGIGNCSDVSDFMVLDIWKQAIVYAGNDANICETETYIIPDATATNYTSLTWSTNGDGSFSNANILSPIYTPGSGDISNGMVTLTLSASSEGNCVLATDELELIIYSLPSAFAGPNVMICETTDSYTLIGSNASEYASLLWETSGTGFFDDPTILYAIYYPSEADIENAYAILTLNAYGNGSCSLASDDMTLIILALPEVFAGNDHEICETENIYLNEATANDYESLLWTSSGDGSFDDMNILHPIYTPSTADILDGNVVLTLHALGNGDCSNESDELLLTINKTALVDVGEDAEICESVDTYSINSATASNYSSLLWTSSGSGVFDNASSLNPNYSASEDDVANGSVILRLTAYGNGNCNNDYDEMRLSITQSSFADAGEDAEICESQASYLIIDANALHYASLSWTTSGDGSFNDHQLLNPIYSAGPDDISSSSVTLTLNVIANGSCENMSNDMELIITKAPIVFAGINMEICETVSSYFIENATASNYTSLLWTTTGTGSFDDPNILNPSYSPSQNDIENGSVDLILTVQAMGSCDEVSNQLSLTISTQAIANAGDDAAICETTSSYHISDAIAEDYISLLWSSSGGGSYDDNSILNPVYTPDDSDIANGSVILSLTLESESSCTDIIDTMILTINTSPIVDAGENQMIDFGSSATLYGTVEGGSGVFEYQWSPQPLLFNFNTLYPSTYDLDGSIWFILTATDQLSGCTGTDSVFIQVSSQMMPPEAVTDYDTTYVDIPIIVDLIVNDTFTDFSNLTISLCSEASHGLVILNDNGTITYTPDLGFDGSDSFCYEICDDGLGGLCDTTMVYIEVLPKNDEDDVLHIYNGLTPNGDGQNDTWFIENIDLYPENDVLIFNRWGDVIIELKNYDNIKTFWDGKNKYEEYLPDGTYYYVIRISVEGQEKVFSGWLYVYGTGR